MLQAKKTLGQHFLKDPKIARKITEPAHIGKNDIVIEIGPGEGILTRELLAQAGFVCVIEKDERAIEVLQKAFAHEIAQNRLKIISADFLDIDLKDVVNQIRADLSLPTERNEKNPVYKIVANIPYYITGSILERIFSCAYIPETVVVLVQKEVAHRAARSQNVKNSILSLSLECYGQVKVAGIVKKGSFVPSPTVDSAILVISRISRDFFETNNIKEVDFFAVVKSGFAHKRKILTSNLKSIAPQILIDKVWQNIGLSPDIRAEDVSLGDWAKIVTGLRK